MARLDAILTERLQELERRGLVREPPSVEQAAAARSLLDACSNDYLGLAARGVSRETLAALEGSVTGAGASRLIHGTLPAHIELERELARWVGLEGALLFSSGFAANVGTIPALAGPGDLVVSDRLNHASIIDGCRLSRARVVVAAHCDLESVRAALETEAARKWVVTESYFSMDGDSPNLPGLRELCDEQGAALVVDEAHALGVFGPQGAGKCAEAGVKPDVLVGTLGKAVGLQGAFVAGSETLRRWLWGSARSQVFSTGWSPLMVELVREHVREVKAAGDARTRLETLAETVSGRLRGAGLRIPEGAHGPIVPVLLGGEPETSAAAAARGAAITQGLARRGIRAQAIRAPTVPLGTERLRITLRAGFSDAEVTTLCSAIIAAYAEAAQTVQGEARAVGIPAP